MSALLLKLKKLHTFYSTYVTYFLMGVAAWWLQISPETQQSILASMPWLRWSGPLVGLVMFMIARGLPQKSVPE